MSWIVLKFLRADWDQVVNIKCLAVNCRPEPSHWELPGAIGAFNCLSAVWIVENSAGGHYLRSCRGSSNHLLLKLLRLLGRGRNSYGEVVVYLNITNSVFIWLMDSIWATANSNLKVDRVGVRRHVAYLHSFNSLLSFLKLFDPMLFWKRSVYNFVAVGILVFGSSRGHWTGRNRWFVAFTTATQTLFVICSRIKTWREGVWTLMTWSTLSIALRHSNAAVIGHDNLLCGATRQWLGFLNEIAPRSLLLLTTWVLMVVRLQVSVHGASLIGLLLQSFGKCRFRTAAVSIWHLWLLCIVLGLVSRANMLQMRLLEIARLSSVKVRLIHHFFSLL